MPHTVKLLKGEKIPGFDNDAKVRTLRVLFDFVKLNPEEVLDLGRDPLTQERVRTIIKQTDRYNNVHTSEEEEIVDVTPNKDEIKIAERNKEARAIKLDSAASSLTASFSEWWKQGDYSFDFKADGDYFKICVSDKKRPAKIELHKRSTGLQWFLSFYLVFLVERQEAHKGAILLLDEAGLTLHPLAQKDLVAFFENLAEENQIIHTTHSPFLVDTSNVDRVKVIYIDKDGYTAASSNLRENEDKNNSTSIYAVYSALGLSVSDILLQGCQPIVVEGPSDQFYLNAVKLYLVKHTDFKPNNEFVFVPSGGAKGVSGVASLLCGRNESLPYVLLDSDSIGEGFKQDLQRKLYKENTSRILSAGDFNGIEAAEIEDLFPLSLMKRKLDVMLRNEEEIYFEDSYNNTKPIKFQIESFAATHGIELPKGWNVELAKSVKMQIQNSKVTIPDETVKMWRLLFDKLNTIDR